MVFVQRRVLLLLNYRERYGHVDEIKELFYQRVEEFMRSTLPMEFRRVYYMW